MSENTTLALDGLFTRSRAALSNFQGFGHCQSDPQDEHDGKARWYWYFTADCDFGDGKPEKRRVFMDQVVYYSDDDEYPNAHQNMQMLSQACMAYLDEHGEWHDRGRAWRPRRVA
jgi:recombinational DNA repair ATPase RecF